MDPLVDLVSTAGNRLTTNLKASFSSMSPEKWIRLVIVVGTYMLLRPYLIKLGERIQMKAYEKEDQAAQARQAQVSPNQLRGQIDIPEDSDDEDGEENGNGAAQASATDWGKKARRRQRDVMKKLLDAEEKRLREKAGDEEDKDIEEYLVKE